MQRILSLSLSFPLLCTAGCLIESAGSNQGTADDQDVQHEEDKQICRDYLDEGFPPCPPTYGYQRSFGDVEGKYDHYVDLATLGTPVCNGHGTFVSAEEAESVGHVNLGFNIIANSACASMCLGGCTFFGVCFAQDEDGSFPCFQDCNQEMTEESCNAFLAECLGEDACME